MSDIQCISPEKKYQFDSDSVLLCLVGCYSRLHQLGFHNINEKSFPHSFCHSNSSSLKQMYKMVCLKLKSYETTGTTYLLNILVSSVNIPNLLCFFDELITVVKPRKKRNQCSFPWKSRCIFFVAIGIQTREHREKYLFSLQVIEESWTSFLLNLTE